MQKRLREVEDPEKRPKPSFTLTTTYYYYYSGTVSGNGLGRGANPMLGSLGLDISLYVCQVRPEMVSLFSLSLFTSFLHLMSYHRLILGADD